MQIAIISDTNGNIDGLGRVLKRLYDASINKVFALGSAADDFEDYLSDLKLQLAAFRGDPDHTEFAADLSELLKSDKDPAAQILEVIAWHQKHVICITDSNQRLADGKQPFEFHMIDGRIVCVIHDPKELKKDEIASASLIFYGSTKIYQADLVGSRYFLNPGHLSNPTEERPQTYGILTTGEKPQFEIFKLDGTSIEIYPLKLEAGTKMHVER